MASYPKGEKVISQRASKPHKRKFYGNRFTREDNEDANNTSASVKKLSSASYEDVIVNPLHCYRIIEFFTVFNTIADIAICRSCNESLQFEECGYRGLGFKIIVTCSRKCGRKEINSGPLLNTGYEINRRIVFVMRLLGISREGINVFCGLMDLCQGLAKSTYDQIVQHLHTASTSTFKKVSEKAIREEMERNVEEGKDPTNIKVSGDGSWKKRGFSSLYGVTTLIAHHSGKVIDLVVESAYCHAHALSKNRLDADTFEEWYDDHKELCSSNHEGSAGKMEVDSVIEMFLRSSDKFGIKYRNYIGDGDSKTFAGILKINPYGDDCPVTKSECVGHVQKRIGTRLRNIKKKEKLGGKNRLTEGIIKKLTTYYGLAIRRNVDSIKGMKRAIMATLDHYCSTDEHPRHQNCPEGVDSWCEWHKAKSEERLPQYEHPARIIDEDVEKHIRPIYEELTKEDLLTRCLGGHTQNSNESFNSAVWRINPKHLHSGQKIIEISAYLAAGIFNEGYSAILDTMQLLELKIGEQAKMFSDFADAQRISRENRRQSLSTKEARMARRLEQVHQDELFEEAEGLLYGPGIAD